jgi:hypothetical protein
MPELYAPQLERSPSAASLAPQGKRLAPAPDRRGLGRQRRSSQPRAAAHPSRGTRSPAASPPPQRFLSLSPRTAAASAQPVAPGRRSVWLPGTGLAPQPDCRGDAPGVWRVRPSRPDGPHTHRAALELAKAGPTGAPARRSGHGALAAGNVAGHQKGHTPRSKASFS